MIGWLGFPGLTIASLSSGFIFSMCLLFRLLWWLLASSCNSRWGISCCNNSWTSYIIYLLLQAQLAALFIQPVYKLFLCFRMKHFFCVTRRLFPC